MRAFWKKWGVFVVIGCFVLLECAYFVTLFRTTEYHVVHVPLDDRIPYLPVFVVFYFIWYAYVPLYLIYTGFWHRAQFDRHGAALLITMLISWLVFLLYPTCIDFIPAPQGKDPFSALCRWLYRIDQPINVFPSLHCANAVVTHLAVYSAGPLRKKRFWRIADAVLCVMICLSTVFIKQHSVLDLIAGVVLALAVYGATGLIARFMRRRRSV